MGKSTLYEIPWPEVTDIPHGPLQMEEIAETVDAIQWASRSLKPTVGVKLMSVGEVELAESYSDLTGCKLEITPPVASNLFVVGSFQVLALEAECEFHGAIKLDAEAEKTQVARYRVEKANEQTTVSQAWVIPLTAAAHTIKLRARRGNGKKITVAQPATSMAYQLFAS